VLKVPDRLLRAALPASVGAPARQQNHDSRNPDAQSSSGFPPPALRRAALHEVYAACEADASVATGFALALARQIRRERPLIWVRQDLLDAEAGFPNPPGLVEFGLDPAGIVRVRARDAQAALQAGLEAARCPSAGVAFIELWGETRALDLTASRRLALAAKTSGVVVLLARSAATPQPSAAETRWRVGAAPSRALPANAPGHPTFAIRLLRDRGGVAGREWRVEWNRDAGCFEDRTDVQAASRQPGGGAPLSRGMVPVSLDRPGAQGQRARDANPLLRDAG
jgi:protein ImuA